ncbi:MAG: FitA-like ribbon-helix-helix domain-containing protein [Bryobacteraceae bacterium]
MATILIRNLDEETKDRLRMLAAKNRRSLEAEVREILRYTVKDVPNLPATPPPLEP